MIPAELESREYPFWTYEDLGLLLGSIIPVLLLTAIVVHFIPPSSVALRTMANQLLIYALVLGVLYLLVAWRYRQPFWHSLRWIPFRLPFLCAAVGPLLAIATSTLGVFLKAPPISPIQYFISDRRSLFIVMLFVTILGPLFEELVFRGFLFPLLARSAGPWLGILITAIAFGLLHGSQYGWAWQDVTLPGLAGAVFGFVRYKTGSTAAATLVHTGYNATLFVGFLISRP